MDHQKMIGELGEAFKELTYTVNIQKTLLRDLETRLAEEKRLCAEWRRRALIAEKENGASGGRIATAAPRNDMDIELRNAGDAVPYERDQDAEERADNIRPYSGGSYALYKRAIRVFGARAQKLKCVEELLELGLALIRDQLGRSDPANIAEERADVRIMLTQLEMIQDDEEAVQAWVNEKLCRLEQTVTEEEKRRDVGIAIAWNDQPNQRFGVFSHAPYKEG
ncbi:MAG: hypothetical protein IJV64_03350 [Oscillospiraceae bacterium]|nr:hypothetical protein [Oscillospiraceae bacterium]